MVGAQAADLRTAGQGAGQLCAVGAVDLLKALADVLDQQKQKQKG